MTPGAPQFSVVVPTYNRRDNLMRLLESISETTFPTGQYEVIVVDDGSNCPLASLSESSSDRRNITVIRQEHSGPAAARNYGASVARGTYIVFIDDDCTVPADWFQNLTTQFSETPTSVVTGRTVNALGSNTFSTTSQMLIEYLYKYFNSGRGSARFFTCNNLALPTSLFRELGGFDVDFTHAAGEDRDLCDRLLHGNRRIVYSSRVEVRHSHHLALPGFLRQHFTYGRGAFLFHRKRTARNRSGIGIEPLLFYTGMLRYPWSRKGGAEALRLSFLLAVTQVVNAAGMAWECVRRRQLP
jgi:glycosyltransferase involved in cell wall biosynthesis